ncbi:transposase [Bacillaceae bacterium IKA-2]|nr:transposase [Bacillaceae bacterium IKA-2]
MGRKPRIEFKGGIYHVIQRGNNREYIFRTREDKQYLLDLVNDYKSVMNFELYGFVFMDNHYHMVLRTLDTRLQDIMHRINNKYSKYYNFQNNRTGHVFENRYKGILVTDDNYLFSLLRYVHQNPVKAKMCERVNDYQWSSDPSYRKNRRGEMVDIDFILNMFSKNRQTALIAYRKFMDADELEKADVFEEGLVIGGNEEIGDDKRLKVIQRRSLDDILDDVTNDTVIYEEIKRGSRKRYLTSYKREYILRSLAANYTMKEVGVNISISEVAVYKILDRG